MYFYDERRNAHGAVAKFRHFCPVRPRNHALALGSKRGLYFVHAAVLCVAACSAIISTSPKSNLANIITQNAVFPVRTKVFDDSSPEISQ